MCIAIYKPAEKSLTKDLLHTCYTNNDDGCGFAYINVDIFGNKKIKVYKSMDFKSFYHQYERATRIAPYSPFMIHFRIGTHGEKTTLNCHPFMVDNETVFCHNGIIQNVGFDKKISDTQLFNNTILKQLPEGWLYNPAIIKLLEDFIGGSKLIVMTLDGSVKILNEKKGEWFEGCWMSNTSYKAKPVYKTATYTSYPSKAFTRTYSLDSYIDCDYCENLIPLKDMEIYEFSPQDVSAYCPKCFALIKDDPELKNHKKLSPFESLRILNSFGREAVEVPKYIAN